jgi:hypothetical protein
MVLEGNWFRPSIVKCWLCQQKSVFYELNKNHILISSVDKDIV